MATSSRKTPLVSIINPTFNDAAYIEASIRSVLAQDFTDFEYIIINDGSTDDTEKIVKRLQKEDARIKLVSQKNQGLVASLNRGLTMAKGKYIARIDGDDEWLPHKLSTQVAALETDDNLVIIGGGALLFNKDSIPTGFLLNVSRDEDIRTGLCLFNQFCHSSVVYRRDIALKAGLYPNTCPAEDYDLFSKFADYGRLANLPYPVFRYRITDGSISAQRREEQNARAKDISLANWSHLRPSVVSRKEIKQGFCHYLTNPADPSLGISLKHTYIHILMRSGYRMINQGALLSGLHQLWNVASTGRTGLKIAFRWGIDIVKIKLTRRSQR